jgi:hypothetical protein
MMIWKLLSKCIINGKNSNPFNSPNFQLLTRAALPLSNFQLSQPSIINTNNQIRSGLFFPFILRNDQLIFKIDWFIKTPEFLKNNHKTRIVNAQ